MKLIFAGTPEFAADALAALLAAGHEVCLVLTQPDRPAGRGMKLQASAVAEMAQSHGLRIEKPISLKSADATELVRACGADVMVVAAYGLLLPQAILDLPRYGCINIHGSLLPRWRGAAPVQRAIEAGDLETGIGIMQMEAGLDTGPILLQRAIPIEPQDTTRSLFAKLTRLGAQCVVQAVAELPQLKPVPQSITGITYAKKIEKAESRIDWSESAIVIERRIRAFDPFPGCETTISGERIRVWAATICEKPAAVAPGVIFDVLRDSFVVACGDQALGITVAQRDGGRRISSGDLMKSFSITTGQQCI